MSGSVPLLDTPRLRLRAHRPHDLDACSAMWADPQVVRFIGGRPFSRQETWSRLLRYAGLWSILGYGYWVVEEKATGEFVGEVGFADFMRELDPPIHGLREVGWALTPKMQGQGYATEALQAALAWNDLHDAGELVACLIAPPNLRSLRVARKCGFGDPAPATFAGSPTLLLTRRNALRSASP